MENVTEHTNKDNALQKTEVTTSMEGNDARILQDDELDKAASVAVEKDNSPGQAVHNIEDSRSDLFNKNQIDIVKDPNEEQIEDKSTASVEEGEIVLQTKLATDKLLDNHPYKDVLRTFEPSSEQLSIVNNIQLPKSLQQTPLIEIDNKDDFDNLINSLKNEKEIGVDVEWSDHGYEALTCLVQLSTKDKDYIIDAIALKKHMLLLNEVFTDPNIVKIFHAATNDLKWLQQDFDVFVVNMFDTQRAMRALGFNKLGLDFALQRYKVVKDKAMQRADFRKRPLPPKFKDYARTDSHFLIHMYQELKNKLIEANSLVQVLNECNNDCRIVYEKIENGPYVSVREDILKIHDRQLVALQKLNQWRHRIAQYADINTGVVLSKNNMKILALELPVDAPTILQICKTEYVRKHLQEIMGILLDAKGINPHGMKGSTRGGFSNKRKIDQTSFGMNDNLGTGPKRPKQFYGGDSHRGRGRGKRQNDFVDLRNTLQQNTFKRNRNMGRRFRN